MSFPVRWRFTFVLAVSVLLFPQFARAAGAIFTSQLGFAASDPKSAVLAVPKGTSIVQAFQILDASTNAVTFNSVATDVESFANGWIANDTLGDTYLLDFTRANLPAGRYILQSNGL